MLSKDRGKTVHTVMVVQSAYTLTESIVVMRLDYAMLCAMLCLKPLSQLVNEVY